MTSRRVIQLTKRVEKWQSVLAPLGLAHYTIDGVTTTNAPGGNDSSVACVTPSQNYDRAVFEFRNDMADYAYDNQDFEYLDQIILHEWLHVAFQSFENAIDLVDDKLSSEQSQIWQEALTNSREQLIDRLARQLYAAFYSDVVP